MVDERRTRLAYRGVSVVYAATTVFFVVLFVRALGRHEIRSGAFSYGLFSLVAAVGLWTERWWARSVALIIAFATSALGAFQAFLAITSHRGPLAGSLIVFVVSTALTYVLTRPVFYLPES